jgi:hypothetical protein
MLMPKRLPARTAHGSMEADGIRLRVYGCNALVLGSGAARGRRVEAARNRCRCRDAKSLRGHVGVLGIGVIFFTIRRALMAID